MFATLVSATLLSLFAVQGVLAEFPMETPVELVQCQPVRIRWTGTRQAPYNVALVPTNDPCGELVRDLGDHSGTSMTWTVDLPAGTNVTFSILDNVDDDAWSGPLTVKESNDTSCLPNQPTTSASAESTESTTSAVSTDAPTTLVIANTFATTTGTTTGTSITGGATPVGAANAGDVTNPFANGALGSVRLPSMTALGALAAALVAAVTL